MDTTSIDQTVGSANQNPKPPTNGRTRRSYDDRLSNILDAATLVFARDGYEKASMRAVARTANVSLAGLYHYFDGKERILYLIQRRVYTALISSLHDQLEEVEDPSEQLRIMINNHLDYFISQMDAFKICAHEVETLTGEPAEQLHAIRLEYYRITREIIDRVIAKQGAADNTDHTDSHVSTMLLFGMLNWLYHWYRPAGKDCPKGLAARMEAMVLDGIMGCRDRHQIWDSEELPPAP